jgi:hypothetical protein
MIGPDSATAPGPRYGHGLTSTAGRLYLFGGFGDSGLPSHDLARTSHMVEDAICFDWARKINGVGMHRMLRTKAFYCRCDAMLTCSACIKYICVPNIHSQKVVGSIRALPTPDARCCVPSHPVSSSPSNKANVSRDDLPGFLTTRLHT